MIIESLFMALVARGVQTMSFPTVRHDAQGQEKKEIQSINVMEKSGYPIVFVPVHPIGCHGFRYKQLPLWSASETSENI